MESNKQYHPFRVTRICIPKKGKIRVCEERHSGPTSTCADSISWGDMRINFASWHDGSFYLNKRKKILETIDELKVKFPAKKEDIDCMDIFDHQSNGSWKTIVLSSEAINYLKPFDICNTCQKKRKRLFTLKRKIKKN